LVRDEPKVATHDKLKQYRIAMRISDFDYHLPEELIAQAPLEKRDASRMLVVDRQHQSWADTNFSSFSDHLRPGDVVVVNNSRVIPARLTGKRQQSGGKVELFLIREVEPMIWETLIRPGARLKLGAIVELGQGQLTAEVLDDPGQEIRRVRFTCEGTFEELLDQLGSTPLPPYIKRSTGATEGDRERYQTVYSKQRGAIAAPTAGLHFTPETLARVRSIATVVEITLHVGYGTFEPVRVDDIEDHTVSTERYEIPESAANVINEAAAGDGRVVVVGTTTMRALESSAKDTGKVVAGSGQAALTIKPGYKFRVANALLTNFHLPQSSLLVLVSAFAGLELTLQAYRHAVDQEYRFYSYGDCMLIV
jgi:S-adenosylmethionine:tRNA ribosyltransferase-isomerase